VSFLFLRASIATTYIYIYFFTAATCIGTIIILEHCALNAEFHQFIPRCNKISLPCGYLPLKEGFGGERRPKDRAKTG
jgi:hypothetical protein